MAQNVTLTNVGHVWPDGSTALTGVTDTFGVGRTGLVGSYGSGISTLLRLIAGALTPTTGYIETPGDVGYLAQTLTLTVDATIADLLDITAPPRYTLCAPSRAAKPWSSSPSPAGSAYSAVHTASGAPSSSTIRRPRCRPPKPPRPL